MAKKKSKVHVIKYFTEYGIHIWAILIIANAALAYAFQFSTHAAQKQKEITTIAQVDDTGIPVEPSQVDTNISPIPNGPIIDLTFTVPGIGSAGGNLQPKRLKRNVTIYLYSLDVNSMNNNVKPLYTIKSTVNYVQDTNSPLYTTFSNHNLDLGVGVKNGSYQLAFRTDESLRTLIKDNPDAIGGQIISLSKDDGPYPIPVQTVLMGDTIPKEGNNTIDISDYNAFINCYGDNNVSKFCSQSNYGDFDDNGVIDGVDYNILLRTFRELLKQGQTIPQVGVTPTLPNRITKLSNPPSPTMINKKPTPLPPVNKTNVATKSNPIGGIVAIFFIILLGIVGFLFIKNENFRHKIRAIIHLSPTGTPSEPTKPENASPPTDALPTPETATEPSETTDIAASTEIPIDQAPKITTADEKNGEIEKSYYIKKKLPDDAKTGYWLTLTDDNGSLEAHFTTKDVTDGFAKVKGTMKSDNGKNYLEITSLTTEG